MMAEGVFAKVCPEQYADTSILKKEMADRRQREEIKVATKDNVV